VCVGNPEKSAGGGLKKPPSTADGPIAKALLDAVAMRRQMLDAGHLPEYVDREIGKGLKALLGNKRPEPWRFYCDRCHDTGWSPVRPSAETEAKLIAMYGTAEEGHGYSVKCDPCPWMQREREKRRLAGQDVGGEDDFVTAGQTKPKRGFSKFGR
jgi:hypothetical protein